MQSVKQILEKFSPTEDKYVSREFQSFGVHLAEVLDDYKHKSLYIKIAKEVHRSVLEKALSFVVDSNAKNKGALFMWKLKQLKKEGKLFENKKQETTNKKQIKIKVPKIVKAPALAVEQEELF